VSVARYAIEFAHLMDAYVDILYVSDLSNFELSIVSDFDGSLGMQQFQEIIDSNQSLENRKAQRIEHKFTRMFNMARCGNRFKFNHRVGAIIDVFDEFKRDATGLDLIILGKYGEGMTRQRTSLGTTLWRILHTSSCPCLIVPNKFHVPRKILIAYNGSEAVNRALHFVERNKFFRECEIHMLTVNPTDDVHDEFDRTRDILRGVANLDVVTSERSGAVVDEINNYVRENGIDLLVTGAYAHSAIRHFFAGSVTNEIIGRTSIPVAVF
jgi:nucleotide-binding universal stress UspA family protein